MEAIEDAMALLPSLSRADTAHKIEIAKISGDLVRIRKQVDS